MLELYTYNAGKGDCCLIRFKGNSGQVHNILIDTGVIRFALELQKLITTISEKDERIDYLIITHADEDHLGGILSLLRTGSNIPVLIDSVVMNVELNINKICINTPLSVKQRNELASRLISHNIPILSAHKGDSLCLDGAVMKIVSPVEQGEEYQKNPTISPLGQHKDYGYTLKELSVMPLPYRDKRSDNKPSIVMIFEYENRRMLFSGDAWSENIVAGLVKSGEKFDLIKMPHHGSVGNISEEWKNRIYSDKFLFCTDGIQHPDKQTIAKLLSWYGSIDIYSPSDWWNRNFLLPEDEELAKKIQFVKTEGKVLEW